MKNFKASLCICFLLIPAILFSAYQPIHSETGTPKVGDILLIDEPVSSNYLHIAFPKPNIILKRSGVYNIDSVRGLEVEITEVKENKDGGFTVKLKPTQGKKFFRHWSSVSADYQKAVDSGELKKKG